MTSVLFYIRKFFLLNKMFLKNPLFSLLLILMPFSSFAFKFYTGKVLKVVNAAVFIEGEKDNFTIQLAKKIFDNNASISYEEVDSKEAVLAGISDGKYTMGFVIPENFRASLVDYERGKVKNKVKIYLKKENILTKLAKEDFYSRIFEYISLIIVNSYIERTDVDLCAEDVEVLNEIYRDNRFHSMLFDITYTDNDLKDDVDENIYWPLRGIISVYILLVAFSSGLMFLHDREKEMFVNIPISRVKTFLFIYIFIPVFDACLLGLFSIKLCGLFTSLQNEIVSMTLYCFISCFFAQALTLICFSQKVLAAVIPPVILSSLIFCPVFINITYFNFVEKLLPPFYYLKSFQCDNMSLQFLIVFFILLLVVKIIPRDLNSR